ncbi:MAG: cyclic nucleotide-binding domain-containing protein [Leeuwenhoekiella sp.]
MRNFQIFNTIQKHIALTDSEIDYLLVKLKTKTFSKKQCILEQGNSCRNIYFVESGSLRAFNTNTSGKESTIMFVIKDWWITNMDCFVNQKPSL